jgi:hypothetical protein
LPAATAVRALSIDRAAGALFGLFAILVLGESRSIPFGTLAEPGPGALPVLLALALLACSAAMFFGRRTSRPLAEVRWGEWPRAAAILGTCCFMALALERLGYRLTIFVALLALVSVVERKRWIAGLAFAGIFAWGTHFLFSTLLRVPLPRGAFGF